MSDEPSVVELRERLARLETLVAEQAAAIERSEAENAELRRRLGQNPRNSGRPPYSEGLAKPPPARPGFPQRQQPPDQLREILTTQGKEKL